MKTEFHILPVSAPFQQWIQFIWVSKGENDTTKTKILPNGAVELILNFGDRQYTLDPQSLEINGTYYRYWVAGLQTRPIIIQSLNDTNLVGVRFLPGGAYPFFNFPISQLTDRVIEADWMQPELDSLINIIGNLSDFKRISRVINEYLQGKLSGKIALNESVQYVINKLLSEEDETTVADLVRKSGYSHKHFLTLFRQQVGTSPKNLQRILRLQKVIQLAKAHPHFNWQNILFHFPFYDAAHFSKDFKELTGMNPDSYLALKTFDENHCLLR